MKLPDVVNGPNYGYDMFLVYGCMLIRACVLKGKLQSEMCQKLLL